MSVAFHPSPDELCVLRLSALGDVCHAVPVVRAIHDAWPNTKITWIVGKTEHSLLRGLEGVNFVVFDKARGWHAYSELRSALLGHRFAALLHMHASMRANAVSLFVRAPIKLGFDRARARDYQWYFCNRRIPAVPRQHVMDALFEFAATIGVKRGALHWDIPIAPEDREFAIRHAGEQPMVVLSPCTGQRFRNYRHWSVERYAAIVDYLQTRHGAKVVLTGGSTAVEQEYGERILELASSAPVNLIGRTNLKQLLALIERARLVICPDSGPAHMATAVQTPVVGLYATSNRFRTGPYLSQDLVVDKYPEAVQREFGCSVEQLRWGQRVRNPDAMNLIELDDVTEKIELAFASDAARPKN
jgi:heptosyltransferase I